MGLTMKETKAVTKEIAQRYQRAAKKQKGLILYEFTALTGYNRSYASYLLSSHSKGIRVTQKVVLKADVNGRVKRQRKEKSMNLRAGVIQSPALCLNIRYP